jgi:hypothetical protein
MVTVLTTLDPIRLSFAEATLKARGIDCFAADFHSSMMEGSILAIPRRLLVAEEDEDAARTLLDAAFAAIDGS